MSFSKPQKRLVKNMSRIFKSEDTDKIPSEQMLELLNSERDMPWQTYCDGNPLNYWCLYGLLKDFGIFSKNVRFGEKVYKGFLKMDIRKAIKMIEKSGK